MSVRMNLVVAAAAAALILAGLQGGAVKAQTPPAKSDTKAAPEKDGAKSKDDAKSKAAADRKAKADERKAKRAEAKRLFLEVADDNIPALVLYSRSGFKEVGRRKGYYQRANGAKADALVLALAL